MQQRVAMVTTATMVKLFVFLDMLAVSIMVPLLSTYFRDAGIDSKLYGLISSLYSLSQILSGFLMGVSLDYLSKTHLLLISFVGSAISYFTVGVVQSHFLLFGSRVLVGLVKQTMTISTGILTECSESNQDRTKDLGHISALASFAFIFGPSFGSLMYRYNPILPALMSSSIFIANALMVLFFENYQSTTKVDRNFNVSSAHDRIYNEDNGKVNDKSNEKVSLMSSISNAFDHFKKYGVFNFFFVRLCIIFISNSMSSRHILNYYQDKFNIETYQLGFIASTTMVVSIVVQMFLITPILNFFTFSPSNNIVSNTNRKKDEMCLLSSCLGLDCLNFGDQEQVQHTGSRQHTHDGKCTVYILLFCTLLNIITSLMEYSTGYFWIFVVLSLIPQMIVSTVLEAVSRSALMDHIPNEHIGKTLGILNMSTSGLSVISPLYGALIFDYFGGFVYKGLVSSVHHGMLLVIILILLLPPDGFRHNIEFRVQSHDKKNDADGKVNKLKFN